MPSKKIEVYVPIIPVSLNVKEFWAKTHKRNQCFAWWLSAIFNNKDIANKVKLPCKVTLIRQMPRSLDYVNLVGSFKFIQDFCADYLIPGLAPGRADGDTRLTWSFEQRKGKPKGTIIIFEEVA